MSILSSFCNSRHLIWLSSKYSRDLEVLFSCPDIKCKRAFIGYYHIIPGRGWTFTGKTSQGNMNGKEFSNTITEISPSFDKIYNEAYKAEQQDLEEICGVGYRKALEFLIKDYLISKGEENEETIKNAPLGQCIQNYVNDDRIKKVAKRAAWLGNDETHYVRKWEG